MRNFNFEEQKKVANRPPVVRELIRIMKFLIPGAVEVWQACLADDKQGVDYWVKLASGEKIGIDVKVREDDWSVHPHRPHDDLALERRKILESTEDGWTFDIKKRCTYVLFFWIQTGRYCLIPFLPLCSIFRANAEQWEKEFQVSQQSSNGGEWSGECVFVPRRLVWEKIFQHAGPVGYRDWDREI